LFKGQGSALVLVCSSISSYYRW